MKACILTYHNGINHGGFLQAYCLQRALESLNVEARILNYVNPTQKKVEWSEFVSKWPKTSASGLKMRFKSLLKYHRFNKAFKRLDTTRPLNSESLIAESEKYELAITGSDEIWNVRNPAFPANLCFFGYGLRCNRLISYGASIGSSVLDDINKPEITECLSQYSNIGVRDTHTASTIGKLGYATTMTLDPTLLHNPYKDFDASAQPDFPYLLIYINSASPGEISLIQSFAREKGLRTVSVSNNTDWADHNMAQAGIEEWLSAYKHAHYVVTNTYHGLIFSILNRKPTWLIDYSRKRNKIESLMNELNMPLSGPGCDNLKDVEACFLSFKDATESGMRRLNQLRSLSEDFLRNAIKI